MHMHFYWFMQVKYFYSASLQHNMHAFSMYPTHQVRVQSAMETQVISRGTFSKHTIPNQTVLLSGNEALAYMLPVCQCLAQRGHKYYQGRQCG